MWGGMITVSILINGKPIFTRSARNNGSERNGKTLYRCDDDSEIWHKRNDGAIKLAKMMLDTINEEM